MRTFATSALILALLSCSPHPPAAASGGATMPDDLSEPARIACMMAFEEDGGPQAYPSPEAYERALARCIEDEMTVET